MPAHMMATTTCGHGGANTCNDDSTSADQKQKAYAFMDEKYSTTGMSLKNDPDNTTQQRRRLYFGRPLVESIALGSISLVMANSIISFCHTLGICIAAADA